MKNKKTLIITIGLFLIISIFIVFSEIMPIFNEKESKNRVFKDMQNKSEESTKGIIGIIPENEVNGLTSYNGIGSGVIFDKKDNTYYAITAKHVIDKKDSKFKIFTKETKFSGEIVKADDKVNFEIPDENYYKSLLDGKVEYKSKTTDLAIISFNYDGKLKVLKFEEDKLSKYDKIMVIGHPEGKRYQISYGYIKSGLKTIRGDKILEHNA